MTGAAVSSGLWPSPHERASGGSVANSPTKPMAERPLSPAGEHHPKGERLRVQHYCCFPGGGIGHYVHELMSRLARIDGVEAELACLPGFQWRQAAAYPLWPGLREIAHKSRLRGRARFLIGQFANPRRLIRRAQTRDAQIIHLSNINHLTYPYWKRAIDRRQVQVVATAHDIERSKAMVNRAFEDRQLRQFYRDAAGLFVHTQAQARHLQEFAAVPSERIHLVPHGPYDYGRPSAPREAVRSRLGLPAGRQIALFFGSIRDDKNLDVLIRCWPRFRDSTHLVIAGRAAGAQQRPVSAYRALVSQLSLEGAVTFIDRYVPDEEVPDLFEACDWVALPYSGQFSSQSGVLNVAVCYDRPVIVTGAASLYETLEQCDVGVVAQADDESALAQGIESLQGRLRNGHRHRFEDYRRLFSWEENARRTVEVYRAVGATSGQKVERNSCRPA